MSNMNITREPTYSVETDANGLTIVRYSVQINNREVVSEFKAGTVGDALSGAKTRFENTIRNRYDIPKSKNIDSLLGRPKREDATTARFRNATGQEINQDTPVENQDLAADLAEIINTSNLTNSEREDLENKEKAEQEKVKKEEGVMIKGKPKNHVPYTISKAGTGPKLDGLGDNSLKEPNPRYFHRKGDEKIEGKNNTIIVLGRDFAPSNELFYSQNKRDNELNSGYSDYMGAGAIDIVAGRMAPFALEKLGPMKDVIVAPCFNTSFPPEVQNIDLTNGKHPGMVMDASRIYVSQMTNVDENFKITKDLFRDSTEDPLTSRYDRRSVVPTSAIVLKSDKLRFHSRQDIKIVTGGQYEKYNSQGNRIKQNNGIHLIAENGIDRDGNRIQQQPIPLGDNLIECLQAMCELLAECVGQLDASVESQLRFNMIVSNSFHIVAPGAPSMPDPIQQLQGVATGIEKIKERFYAFFQDINNFTHRVAYFNPMSEKYINSRYNTTN